MNVIHTDREFYMVLPSNVQPNIHPTNTASSWRTTFEESYDLYGGQWEVALTEITYINTIPTLINESFELTKRVKAPGANLLSYPISIEGGDITKIRAQRHAQVHANIYYDSVKKRVCIRRMQDLLPITFMMKKDYLQQLGFIDPQEVINPQDTQRVLERKAEKTICATFPPKLKKGVTEMDFLWYTRETSKCSKINPSPGYYLNGSLLAKELNQPTSDLKHYFTSEGKQEVKGGPCSYQFAFLPQRNRFALSLGQGTNIRLHEGLHDRLGFEKKTYKAEKDGNHFVARYMPQLNRGIHNIYIYCNVCAPIRVGNVLAPLLRTIELSSRYRWGEARCIRFDELMYTPVQASCFNSIAIDLYDDSGVPIRFEEGRTTLVLHFRRVAQRV